MLMEEKCAKRSSPPPSGVIKPKPFESLNHLTVPIAIVSFRIKKGLSPKQPSQISSPKEQRKGRYLEQKPTGCRTLQVSAAKVNTFLSATLGRNKALGV